MKPKVYPPNCTVKDKNKQPIIIITYNECNFVRNDFVRKG